MVNVSQREFICAADGRSAMSNSSPETHDFDAWFTGFFDGEGCIRISIADRERYSTGFEFAPMLRITHEQLTGTLDAEDWIGVKIDQNSEYQVNHRLQPRIEVTETYRDHLMEALCAYCDAHDVNCHVSSLEANEDRSDQYIWGVQGISNTRTLLTPLRDQFIVKREQVDLLLDEILPRMEQGVHHEKEGFLEVMYHVDQFNSYKGGSRGQYTLDYFEDLWGIEYTSK